MRCPTFRRCHALACGTWVAGKHGLKQVTSASSLERLKFKLNMVVYAVLQECSLLVGAESRYAKPCEHGVSP